MDIIRLGWLLLNTCPFWCGRGHILLCLKAVLVLVPWLLGTQTWDSVWVTFPVVPYFFCFVFQFWDIASGAQGLLWAQVTLGGTWRTIRGAWGSNPGHLHARQMHYTLSSPLYLKRLVMQACGPLCQYLIFHMTPEIHTFMCKFLILNLLWGWCWATPGLCSGLTSGPMLRAASGGAWVTIFSAGDQTRVGCVPSRCHNSFPFSSAPSCIVNIID